MTSKIVSKLKELEKRIDNLEYLYAHDDEYEELRDELDWQKYKIQADSMTDEELSDLRDDIAFYLKTGENRRGS